MTKKSGKSPGMIKIKKAIKKSNIEIFIPKRKIMRKKEEEEDGNGHKQEQKRGTSETENGGKEEKSVRTDKKVEKPLGRGKVGKKTIKKEINRYHKEKKWPDEYDSVQENCIQRPHRSVRHKRMDRKFVLHETEFIYPDDEPKTNWRFQTRARARSPETEFQKISLHKKADA